MQILLASKTVMGWSCNFCIPVWRQRWKYFRQNR